MGKCDCATLALLSLAPVTWCLVLQLHLGYHLTDTQEVSGEKKTMYNVL